MPTDVENIRRKFEVMSLVLDERRLRLWAAAEADALGRGGLKAVMDATGLWNSRIVAGKRELAKLRESPPPLASPAARPAAPWAATPAASPARASLRRCGYSTAQSHPSRP